MKTTLVKMTKVNGIAGLLAMLSPLLSVPALSEPLNLGEGLIIETPAPEDLIFQTIPSYDASKKMLVHRSGEQLQYFISINRLPRGAADAEQYFTRLIRDLDAASVRDSVEIIDQGQYRSDAGLTASYLEYSFTPNGSNRTQHQIAHFMTNSSRTFVAISVLVDDSAIDQMRNHSLAAFKTASLSNTINSPAAKAGASSVAADTSATQSSQSTPLPSQSTSQPSQSTPQPSGGADRLSTSTNSEALRF